MDLCWPQQLQIDVLLGKQGQERGEQGRVDHRAAGLFYHSPHCRANDDFMVGGCHSHHRAAGIGVNVNAFEFFFACLFRHCLSGLRGQCQKFVPLRVDKHCKNLLYAILKSMI